MNCICCCIVTIVKLIVILFFVYKLAAKAENIWMQYKKYNEDRKSSKRKVKEEYRKLYLEYLKDNNIAEYEKALKQLSEIQLKQDGKTES